MRNFLILSAITVLLSACGKQPVEQFKNISNRTWMFDNPENFVVNITNPGAYKMQVQVRYTQEYLYSNIWVAINEKSPDGTKADLRLNIPLFDVLGRPFGSFAGKFYDRSFPDAEVEAKQLTLNFPKAGQYTFTLQHNMRTEKLDGISEIGIRLKAL